MTDFEFYNPVKVFFGKDQLRDAEEEFLRRRSG